MLSINPNMKHWCSASSKSEGLDHGTARSAGYNCQIQSAPRPAIRASVEGHVFISDERNGRRYRCRGRHRCVIFLAGIMMCHKCGA